MLTPYSAQPILSSLTNGCDLYSYLAVAQQPQQMAPTALRFFDWQKGASDHRNSYENRTAENKIAYLLSKYKLDFAYLSACLADNAKYLFGKSHSAFKFLTKENAIILLLICPGHLVSNTTKKGCYFLTCAAKVSIMCILVTLPLC